MPRMAKQQSKQQPRVHQQDLLATPTPHWQSRLLTKQITGCGSWQQLQQLLHDHELSFNIIHVSAMLGRLGKLLRQGSQQLPEQELAGLELFMQRLEAKSLELMSVVLVSDRRIRGRAAVEMFVAQAWCWRLQD
jgi:hypothetical protein